MKKTKKNNQKNKLKTQKSKLTVSKAYQVRKWAPLNSGFMLIAIIGFFISTLYVYPKLSKSYGFAFALVFVAMFIAAMLNMTRASPDEELKLK